MCKILLMSICFAIIDQVIVLMNIRIFDSYFKIPISKVLEFNNFKFNRFKVRFVSDKFNQNSCIDEYYREFEKFSFCSQLYILTYLHSFSMLIIVIGLKIILQSKYVVYSDPVLLVVLSSVWVCGQMLLFLLSFIVLKFKFYEKK